MGLYNLATIGGLIASGYELRGRIEELYTQKRELSKRTTQLYSNKIQSARNASNPIAGQFGMTPSERQNPFDLVSKDLFPAIESDLLSIKQEEESIDQELEHLKAKKLTGAQVGEFQEYVKEYSKVTFKNGFAQG